MSKLILFQGDSITDGNRIKTNEWDLNHQMGHGYAFLINAKLGCENPEKNYRFINRGISGNRIAHLYGRWQEDTLRYAPDIISVLIGANDCVSYLINGIGSVDDKFEKTYQLLIDYAIENNPNTKFVICEPFALPCEKSEYDYNELMEILRPVQEKSRAIAEVNNAVFVPLQKKFEQSAEKYGNDYWIWDGIHPTVCGHQLIANEWLDNCKNIL